MPSDVKVWETVVMPLTWWESVPLGMPKRSIQSPVRGVTVVGVVRVPKTGKVEASSFCSLTTLPLTGCEMIVHASATMPLPCAAGVSTLGLMTPP